MALTVTFLILDPDGTERVLRRTVIPDDALAVHQSSPEMALTIAQGSGLPRPDGFRITDGDWRVRLRFSQPRRT